MPTIDRFADDKNTKLPWFNARFFQCSSRSNRLLFTRLGHGNQLGSPPISLVLRAIEHCKNCQAQMIRVVPLWRSAVFWETLSALIYEPNPFFKESMALGDIFQKGTTETLIFGSDKWRGSSLAVHLDFRYKK